LGLRDDDWTTVWEMALPEDKLCEDWRVEADVVETLPGFRLTTDWPLSER
jgi:hypothetical protein